MIERVGELPKRRFAKISQRLIDDGSLTSQSRHILMYLLSRPNGWQTSAARLARSSAFQKEGRDTIQRSFKELEEAGYLIRQRMRGPKGTWQYRHLVTDTPFTTITDLTVDGKPVNGSSAHGQPGDLNQTGVNKTSLSSPDVVSSPF